MSLAIDFGLLFSWMLYSATFMWFFGCVIWLLWDLRPWKKPTITCNRCNGSGLSSFRDTHCGHCNGSGRVSPK